MSDERLQIRSYRPVFRVDRRIYRIDRWAIPVPGGVPLRGVAYFCAALFAVLVLSALPVAGALLDQLSPPLRYVVLPLAVAVLGTQVAPDGRLAHRFAADWLRLRFRRRRRSAGRPVPLDGEPVPWAAELAVRPDDRGPRLRRSRVRGPAHVTFTELVELRRRRRPRRVVARPLRRRRRRGVALDSVAVEQGQVLEIRP